MRNENLDILPSRFNVRVYGLAVFEQEILTVCEQMGTISFRKFPGGGLQFGEGLVDALKREFIEESGISVEPELLFYVNDFLQISRFNTSDQLLAVYYTIQMNPELKRQLDIVVQSGVRKVGTNHTLYFEWLKLSDELADKMDFPIDKAVCRKL